MTTSPMDRVRDGAATIRGRADQALRQAAHLSKEARMLKTLASDAVQDARRAARRAFKQATARALDARDELAYRTKRQPFQALGIAFGVGASMGLILGWARRRGRNRRAS